jgi:hypothetical protein
VSLSQLGRQVSRALVRKRREAGLPSCYRVISSRASRVRRSRPSVQSLLIEEVCNFLQGQSVVAGSRVRREGGVLAKKATSPKCRLLLKVLWGLEIIG